MTQSLRSASAFLHASTVLALALMASARDAAAHDIAVGTQTYPDLAAAIADVPRLRSTLPAGEPIDIHLPPGVMRLTAPVVIDAAHGGTDTSRLTIHGAADGSTRLVGARVVPTRPATTADSGGLPLPPGTLAVEMGAGNTVGLVRRGAYAHPAQAGIELFQGAQWLTLSRWPQQGYATASATGTNATGPHVVLPPDKARAWQHEPALWAIGYWGADWSYEMAPVTAVDAGGGTATLAPLQEQPQVRPKVRFAMVNAISDLSAPGTYVVIPARHLALVVPAAGGGAIEMAVAPRLIAIQGAKAVTLDHLAMDRALGTALSVENGSDIRIIHCAIRQTGLGGASVTGGDHVVFTDSVIAGTAETGVTLSGGNRASLAPGNHAFVNGIIEDFGRESPSYRPGASLSGVGNRIEGSLVSGGRHNGIMLSGNDHRVIGNEVSNLLKDAEDSGAIYMGADWSQRGNLIQGNYIHDLGGTRPTSFLSSVYLDDQFSGTSVIGNVMVGGEYGVVIGGGRDNRVTGNLMIGQRLGGVHFDQRGRTSEQAQTSAFAARLAAVPTHDAVWSARYPALAALDPTHFGEAGGNVVSGNVTAGPPLLVADPAGLATQVAQQDNRSVARGAPDALAAQTGLTLARRGAALTALQPMLEIQATR